MTRVREDRRVSAALLAAATLATVALTGCSDADPPATSPGGGPVEYLNHAADVDYVGAEACRECHAEIASSYARTGMGRAYYPLTSETEIEDFDDRNTFTTPSGLTYRMEKRDGRYLMRQFVPDSRGREQVADEREMQFVLGSGNHARSYVTEVDGQLYQLPICWYPRASLWDVCPGFEHDSSHFRRHATPSCVFCHNGRMVDVEGAISAYRSPVPNGIGCERCHGPGEEHVARWREGGIPTGGLDPTIVNPRRLPQPERIEVCFQCHLGDSKATERVATIDASLLDWRPGQRLGVAIEPFRFATPTRHDFGLSAQADRLVLSECWKQSGGQIDCITCHDPHTPVYDPDRAGDFFNRRCRGCHDRDDCAGPPAARAATAPEDDCTGCHMRRAEPDDQRYTVMTDHWIRRSIDESRRDPRADLSIEPTLPDSLAARPPAEQAFYRARANYLLSFKTADPRRRSMWEQAERDFDAAIAGGLDRADAWFFLGRVRQYLGRPGDALEAFDRSVAIDPAYDDAALALGTALLEAGQVARSREVLGAIVERDPGHAGALAELGRSHLGEDLGRALALYEQAAGREPWNGALYAAQGMILAQTGRFEAARERTREALRRDPEDGATWGIHARILAELGLEDEAREAAAIAARMERAR